MSMSHDSQHSIHEEGQHFQGNQWGNEIDTARRRISVLTEELALVAIHASELTAELLKERSRNSRLLSMITGQSSREAEAAHDLAEVRQSGTEELERYAVEAVRSSDLLTAMTAKYVLAAKDADAMRTILDGQDPANWARPPIPV